MSYKAKPNATEKRLRHKKIKTLENRNQINYRTHPNWINIYTGGRG